MEAALDQTATCATKDTKTGLKNVSADVGTATEEPNTKVISAGFAQIFWQN